MASGGGGGGRRNRPVIGQGAPAAESVASHRRGDLRLAARSGRLGEDGNKFGSQLWQSVLSWPALWVG